MPVFAHRHIAHACIFGLFLSGPALASGQQDASRLDVPSLPDAPSSTFHRTWPEIVEVQPIPERASNTAATAFLANFAPNESSSNAWEDPQNTAVPAQQNTGEPARTPSRTGQQPKRILGLMPNYRAVSSGTIPPPPTMKQNFKIATRQAFDYSAFVFLGITSATAYAQNSHPSLQTWNGGDAVFWAYLWRGFIDKTDGNYLAAFVLPTLLREDTRYYAMGEGSKWKRLGYAASRVAIARTYHGRTTPNFAGIGGKVAAQAISPNYYPPGSSDFGVLATKFAYSVARDMGFTVFREFWPDIAIHVLHRNP